LHKNNNVPITNTTTKIKKAPLRCVERHSSDLAGIRTQDPNIKSVMLYRLSYEIIFNVSVKSGANIGFIEIACNPISNKFSGSK
jgi:hypothetical protein